MFQRIIKEYELGVEWHEGKVVGLLKPGKYSFARRWKRQADIFDTRQTPLRIVGQEVILGDRTSLKINVAGSYRVVNPVQLVRQLEPAGLPEHLNLLVQLCLRDTLSTTTLDDLLEKRDKVNEAFHEGLQSALARLGVELNDIRIKDVILPSELRVAYTESLSAQLRAKAQLEQARGQSAALRNLANTADLLEKHPQLVQLLTLQKKDSNLNLYFDNPGFDKKK